MKPRESAKAKAAASTKSCPRQMRQRLPEPAINEPLWTERFEPSYPGKRALSFGGIRAAVANLSVKDGVTADYADLNGYRLKFRRAGDDWKRRSPGPI